MQSDRYTKEEAVAFIDMLDEMGEKDIGIAHRISGQLCTFHVWLLTAGKINEFLVSALSSVFMSSKYGIIREILLDVPLEDLPMYVGRDYEEPASFGSSGNTGITLNQLVQEVVKWRLSVGK